MFSKGDTVEILKNKVGKNSEMLVSSDGGLTYEPSVEKSNIEGVIIKLIKKQKVVYNMLMESKKVDTTTYDVIVKGQVVNYSERNLRLIKSREQFENEYFMELVQLKCDIEHQLELEEPNYAFIKECHSNYKRMMVEATPLMRDKVVKVYSKYM